MKKIRKEKGISIGEISSKTGVNLQTVYRWSHGKGVVQYFDLIRDLIYALDVEPNELFDWENQTAPEVESIDHLIRAFTREYNLLENDDSVKLKKIVYDNVSGEIIIYVEYGEEVLADRFGILNVSERDGETRILCRKYFPGQLVIVRTDEK